MQYSYRLLLNLLTPLSLLAAGPAAQAQITAAEGVNLPGTWNTYAAPGVQPFGGTQASAGSPDRRFLLQSTLPTRRYSTTINCQSSGGDVVGGTYDFLFTSGPAGGYFNNKWNGPSVITVANNTVQTYNWVTSGGSDNRVTLANGTYYTVNWKDAGYTNTSAIFLTTTSAPVTVSAVSAAAKAPYVSATQLDGVATTVTATISASLPSDQRVYLHYSDNTGYTGTTGTNGDIVLMTGSGTSYTADIPAAFNVQGKAVYYYVFTTNTSATPTYSTPDVSLRAIRYKNNNTVGGYTYTASGHATAPGATVWSNPASWAGGSVPPSGAAVTVAHNLTLDQTASVRSLTVSAGTFTLADGSSRTLTVGSSGAITVASGATLAQLNSAINLGANAVFTNNGTFTATMGVMSCGSNMQLLNNGTYTPGSSTIQFAGTGVVGGSQNTSLSNVTLAGGVNFGGATTTTITESLRINFGGFVIGNAPAYAGSSTLVYNTGAVAGAPYGRGLEWSATSGKGYPFNVSLEGNTFVDLGNGGTGVLRQCAGNLTVAGGSGLFMDFGSNDMTQPLVVTGNVTLDGSLSLSDVNGGDLKVSGDLTRNTGGTLTPNGRAVFMQGSGTSTITGTGGLDLDYLVTFCPTLQLGSDVNVFAPGGGNGVSMNGNINLRGWKLQIRSGADLQVVGALRSITTSGGTGPGAQLILRRNNTVTQTGGGTLNIGTSVRVITGEYGVVTPGPINFGGITTINGTLEIQTGGFVDGSGGNGPLYGSSSNLIYNTGASYDRRSEWDGQNTARTPFNVTVTGNTTLNAYDPGVSTGDINLPGTLTITSGSTFNAGSQPNDFVINGTLTNAGTLTLSSTVGGDTKLGDDFINTGTFNANGRAVWFIGGNQQDVSSTSALVLSYVVMSKTAGKVNLLSNISIPAASGGTAILWQTSTSTFDLNGRTLTVGTAGVGAVMGTPPAGSGFSGTTASTLILLGTGDAGTLTFVTGGQQLGTLTLDRTASGLVTLGSPLTLQTALNLTNGRIRLDANTLTMAPSATITGVNTSTYIETNSTGALARQGLGTSGVTTAVLFPVGSATAYNPAVLTNTGVLDTYAVRVSGTSAFAPPFPARQISRFWTVTETTVGGSNATLRLQWVGAQEGASFNRAGTIVLVKNDGLGFSTVPATLASAVEPYTAEATGITSFSEWSVGNDDVLPVELLFFSGRMSGPDALLAWQTASERDNQLFDVERSLDGQRFERIGTLPGAGTSLTAHAYRFTDRGAALLGVTVLYYRLRQLDFDGKTSFSSVVTLAPGATDGTSAVIFPNLISSDDFTLECFTKQAAPVEITFTDAGGRKVYVGSVAIAEGYTDIPSRTLPKFAGLAPGMYTARIVIPGQPPVQLKVVRQ